ncbi:penicillin-binding protein [Streptomyces spiroverticillatus]|uniref:Penicillin-binding protein n=1 Tax=Streptomyces finlayi TaxID=67296 RepID=A0A918WUE3_9ACTN|nr:penicillin-binding protein 2 [Streptomyces finlayi]GGZ99024.1 penicillin-binding protein [Streptomyces spiroverticillatus]GHC83824.1 penicillin-binding protein [Streptomyces finlayi]
MNKPLRRVAIFCGILVLALLVRVNWVQFVQGDKLKNHGDNRRVLVERYAHPRGDIIVDGKAVTGSVEAKNGDLKYKRTYKDGAMWSPVTGFASQVYGATQLEKIHDGILSGTDDRLFFDRTLALFSNEEKKGGNVVTTLNGDAQRAAYEGLKGKKGAVAALDPKTGKILALASTPSYDPSKIAGMGDADAWKQLDKKVNPDDISLNRALRQTYPPGSTFKVVTAAAALEHGKVSNIDDPTDTPLPWTLPDTRTELKNEGDIPCKNATLRVALQWSCNTVFGKLGVDVGKDAMKETAEKFGFNSEQFTPVRSNASVWPKKLDRPQTALSSIGQFETAATPLQMAMVTAAIANDGKLMTPYMVDKLTDPNLDVVKQTDPTEMSQPLSADNAQKVQQLMETVVKEGTGKRAQIDGVTVGGKTGTAQHGVNNEGNPYAWFISYAKTDKGSPVAVAVVVEDSEAARGDISGGGLAAPIAKNVMKAVLDRAK